MPVLMIRYRVTEDGVTEVAEAVTAAFAAITEREPAGVRYAYLRDGTEFVAFLQLDDGVDNPLPGIAEARHLQAVVARWAAGDAPAPQPLDLLGTYRLFD